MFRVLAFCTIMLFSLNLFAEKQYIVVYKQGIMSVRSEVNSLESVTTLKKINENTDVIKADEVDIDIIRDMSQVDYVEEDKILTINETWGLDRIDARKGLDNSYSPEFSGEGVHAYIIDTGVNLEHEEFAGRIGDGFSSIKDKRGLNDCQGHGSHVAGTVGGTRFGVAKEVTIHPVRVLDCKGSGYTSGVVEGVEWIADNHQKPAVANMSLGGSSSRTLDMAVKKAIDSGVSFVVAAGNENRDACKGSPSGVKEAIGVGASDADDRRPTFSNWGDCVDLFAPGVQIKSAWKGETDGYKEISGTSMAAPHVAGAVALRLFEAPNSTPAEIETWIKEKSTKGIISNSKTKLNDLLYVGPEEGEPRPEPVPEPEPEEPSFFFCDWLGPILKRVFKCPLI